MRHHARLLTVGAALVVTTTLSACGAPPPNPTPDPPAATPQAVLTAAQDQATLDAVGKAVTEADTAKDASLLQPRVFGPALAMRTSQIAVAKATSKDDGLTELPNGTEQLIVPTTQAWPRTSFAITEQPASLVGAQRLMALEQTTARDQYKLWGWVQLFPGTMPTFADPAIGSAAVAPNDKSSLLVTPADAVAQYADLVNLGSASAFTAAFQPTDPLREKLTERAGLWKNALATASGTYSLVFTLTPGERVRAIRTADGGALVMGALTGVETMTAEAGAKVPPGTESEKAFFGATAVTNTLKMTYQDVVALYVPPAGSTETIKVLGAQPQLISVTT